MKYRIGDVVWIFGGSRKVYRGVLTGASSEKDRYIVKLAGTVQSFSFHISTIFKSKRAALGKAVKMVKNHIAYYEKGLKKYHDEIAALQKEGDEK